MWMDHRNFHQYGSHGPQQQQNHFPSSKPGEGQGKPPEAAGHDNAIGGGQEQGDNTIGSDTPGSGSTANPAAPDPAAPNAGNTAGAAGNTAGAAGNTGSDAGKVVSTGTGSGHLFNVTNQTSEAQYFAFSAGSNRETGFSNNTLAVMKLEPGESASFESGSDVPGIRISTSGANGETNMNQILYEDTVQTNPMGGGGIVHNPNVSRVAGTLGYNGNEEYIQISDGNRTIGDNTETGSYDFDIEDENPDRATNPMNMALNPATSYDITFFDSPPPAA